MNILLIVWIMSKEEALLCSSSLGGNDMSCWKKRIARQYPMQEMEEEELIS